MTDINKQTITIGKFKYTINSDGWLIGKDFYGRIVGYYDRVNNRTLDFHHRIVCFDGFILDILVAQANGKIKLNKINI